MLGWMGMVYGLYVLPPALESKRNVDSVRRQPQFDR